MGKPEQQMRFLGCDHKLTHHTIVDHTGQCRVVTRMEYDMEPFFRGCLDKWSTLTGTDWHNLPQVSTPFVDEDALRKAHGIGPLEFQLPEPNKG